MWQCLKLPRFSIQTTEKLFMPNVMIVTFDSNTVYGARDSVGILLTLVFVRLLVAASRTIMNKFNVIQTWPVQIPNIIFH